MAKIKDIDMSNLQVENHHYVKEDYDKKCRFISYWHQIEEIRKTKPMSVLEIGVGNGLVRDYIKRLDINIIALDIDQHLHPDFVGTVLDIPFPDNTFDTIACFQVLEHLPFKDFSRALREISRVSKKHVLLSLPDVHRVFTIHGHAPGFGHYQAMMPIPRLKKIKHQFDGQHYWEIGKNGYSVETINNKLHYAGLILRYTYRVSENPYHRFFILEKR